MVKVAIVAALQSAAKNRLAPTQVVLLHAETHVPAIQVVQLLVAAPAVLPLATQVVPLLAERAVLLPLVNQLVPLHAVTVVPTAAPRLANQAAVLLVAVV